MDLITPILEQTERGKTLQVPDGAGILIVSENDAETEALKSAFPKEKFTLECVRTMTEACDAAKSDRFQVIFSAPLLKDGSWRRLMDIAYHYDLCFEVILWAGNFDVSERVEALNDRAFDVLDSTHEQGKVIEVTKRALWAALLKGAGPRLGAINSRRVA